jgi:hypothetical protein
LVEIVLETATPDGIRVVLPALVCAKIVEEHAAHAERRVAAPDALRLLL